MSRLRFIWITAWVLCSLACPEARAREQAGLRWSLDTSVFQGEDQALLDVMLLVDRLSLTWAPLDSGYAAALSARIRLQRDLETFRDTTLSLGDYIADPRTIGGGQKIPVLARLPVSAGALRVRLDLADEVAGTVERKDRRLRVPSREGRPSLSSIRLSASAPTPASEGAFVHGGWFCLPYADALFNADLPDAHGLIDVYDLPENTTAELALRLLDDTQYLVREEILPLEAAERQTLPLRWRMGDLPSGAWFCEVQLRGGGAEVWSSSRKSVYTINPEAQDLPGRIRESEFDHMDPLELAAFWQQCALLAEAEEERRWQDAGTSERRELLKEFWQRRDPDPRTRANERLAEFRRHIREAEGWAWQKTPGWQTDRGRVLVRYGEPGEKDDRRSGLSWDRLFRYGIDVELRSNRGFDSFSDPAPGERLADDQPGSDFEVWYYPRSGGGSIFVFMDREGFGEFELIHSTQAGEYFDPDWLDRLFGNTFFDRR